jgi:hypothetical protein
MSESYVKTSNDKEGGVFVFEPKSKIELIFVNNPKPWIHHHQNNNNNHNNERKNHSTRTHDSPEAPLFQWTSHYSEASTLGLGWTWHRSHDHLEIQN